MGLCMGMGSHGHLGRGPGVVARLGALRQHPEQHPPPQRRPAHRRRTGATLATDLAMGGAVIFSPPWLLCMENRY